MLRRSLLAAALAGVLAVLSVGSTLGHECTNSSRSAQGDEGVLNSQVWGTLTLADVLGFIHFEIGEDPLTADQIAWAVANRGDLPESWVIRVDKTIGANGNSPSRADGRGLDHLVPMVGDDVVALYFAAAAQPLVQP
jgi:hypothetical protein